MKFSVIGMILFCGCGSLAFATDGNSNVPHDTAAVARISVRTSPPGAKVFCDTLYLGTTPIDSVIIPSGWHTLTYVQPDAESWYSGSLKETLVVRPSESVDRRPVFPSICRITSTPFGASVVIGDSVVGETPLLLANIAEGTRITFEKEGFEKLEFPFHSSSGGLHVDLTHLSTSGLSDNEPYLTGIRTKSDLPIYLTTSASVITGVVAAYCKIKADSYYNDYSQNGDQRALTNMRRMDTISGISLVASEVSFMTLCYLLISR